MKEQYTIVAFDITNDRLRAKIVVWLQNAGFCRVQKSVFEGLVKPLVISKLKNKFDQIMEKGDSIRYYKLCSACTSNIESSGKNSAPQGDEQVIIV